MHAAARPAKDRGLHEVWFARIDHHARCQRRGRRQISSGGFRLDGARVSLRRFDGHDFRDASSRLTAERRTSRSSPQEKFTIFLPFTKNCRTTNRYRNRAESNSRGLTKERAGQARPLQSQLCWGAGRPEGRRYAVIVLSASGGGCFLWGIRGCLLTSAGGGPTARNSTLPGNGPDPRR